MLQPREEKLNEVLKSLKIQVFDLEMGLQRSAEPENAGTITQAMLLSASAIYELVALPEIPRFEASAGKTAVAKAS